jgi:hypothetical protein
MCQKCPYMSSFTSTICVRAYALCIALSLYLSLSLSISLSLPPSLPPSCQLRTLSNVRRSPDPGGLASLAYLYIHMV